MTIKNKDTIQYTGYKTIKSTHNIQYTGYRYYSVQDTDTTVNKIQNYKGYRCHTVYRIQDYIGCSLQDTGLCRIQIPSSIPIPFSVQDTGP